MSFSLVPGSPYQGVKQYESHINKLSYLKNLSNVTDNVGDYILANIAENTNESLKQDRDYYEKNLKEKQKFSLALNGTLQEGFYQLSENLSENFSELSGVVSEFGENLDSINDNIQAMGQCLFELNNLLDWKTDRIIEAQNKANEYLMELRDAVTKPIENEKKELLNKSGMYLNSAINEGPNSEHFNKSIYFLNKIDVIDPYDFISNFQKGIIYSQSLSLLNIDTAIKCFLDSIENARVIINSEKINATKKELANEIIRTSHYYLSICNYAKENFFEALFQAQQAYKLMPDNPTFCIRLAKMFCVNMRESEAIEFIDKAIGINANYINEVINDDDIISKATVKDYLNQNILPLIDEVKNRLIELNTYSIPETKEEEELQELQQLFKNSYISARNCTEILTKTKLEERIDEVNLSFYKAREVFENDKAEKIKSIVTQYRNSNKVFEDDFAKEAKPLGLYTPSIHRYYLEKNSITGEITAYSVNKYDINSNVKLIRPFRLMTPLIKKLYFFDFIWPEWVGVHQPVSEQNSVSKIINEYPITSFALLIQRNLNQCFLPTYSEIGVSTCLITKGGYFIDFGHTFNLVITNPISLLNKYPNASYALEIADKISKKIKDKFDKLRFREIRYNSEVLNQIKDEVNQLAIENNEGFEIKYLEFKGYTRYSFKTYRLEPVEFEVKVT